MSFGVKFNQYNRLYQTCWALLVVTGVATGAACPHAFASEVDQLAALGELHETANLLQEADTFTPPHELVSEGSELLSQSTSRKSDSSVSYDYSSFKQEGLQTFDYCFQEYTPDLITQSGHRIKMLGAAFVYMSPSNGKSVLGHLAERFVYCRDEQLFDVLYDYAPLGQKRMEKTFEPRYGIRLADYPEEVKKSYADSLYVDLIFEPAKTYSENQFYLNRTVFEAWFDVDGPTQYQMLLANTLRFKEQSDLIKRKEPLPKYKLFKNNCTKPVKQDLQVISPDYIAKHDPRRLTPSGLYGYVKNHQVQKIIVYPSQRMFRILQLKAQGKSTLFENIVPLSKASPNGMRGHWVLLYPEAHGFFKRLVWSPVSGVVNAATGVVETAYGVVTIPTNLLGHIPGLGFLKTKKGGLRRVARGLGDVAASLGEVVWLRTRYPASSQWTEAEVQFFQEYAQASVLLEFLSDQYETPPVLIY